LAINPNARPTAGVYDEQTIQANRVDFNAAGINLNAERFSARVRDGYLRNFGGVIDGAFFGEFYSYGKDNSKVFDIIWNDALIGAPATTTPISGATGFSANSRDVTMEFIPIMEGALPGERPVEAGITLLSQGTTAANFGTVTVRALLDNNTNIAATRTINQTNATGDTFFGFTAPAGRYLTGLQITHQHATSARIGFDDLGFRTAVVAPFRSVVGAAADASAVQNGATYNIINGEDFINVRNFPGGDKTLGILEFSLANLPVDADIVDVLLEIDTGGQIDTLLNTLSVFGYGGDGQITAADALNTTAIATRQLEGSGILAMTLDSAFVESLVSSGATHLGLVLSESDGKQMSFDTSESGLAAINPTLTINYASAVPEPAALSLAVLAAIGLLRRRPSK
jgi:MYXO-CTERM domain-containing protein